MALDDAGVGIPIHVFGSLDPLISPIYWLAGAEIFDGLTWINMAYDPDLFLAVYANFLLPIRAEIGHSTKCDVAATSGSTTSRCASA